MILKNGIILYHASYAKIEEINLTLCAKGKDFGTGFYLTTDYNQAVKFIKTSIIKAIKNNQIDKNTNIGYVSKFIFEKKDGVKIFEFKKADKKWLHYVAQNRKNNLLANELEKLKDFDIILGKIANDATNRVITAYINNTFGKAFTDDADKSAIKLLLPNKLSNQVCFKSQKAISCLKFIGAEEILL